MFLLVNKPENNVKFIVFFIFFVILLYFSKVLEKSALLDALLECSYLLDEILVYFALLDKILAYSPLLNKNIGILLTFYALHTILNLVPFPVYE